MTPSSSLLDTYVPVAHFAERHERFIAAPPETVLAAVEQLEIGEVALLAPLMALRMLPSRLRGRPITLAAEIPVMEAFCREGFVTLGRRPGHEIALGVVGRFWRLAGNAPNRAVRTAGDFASFDEPGWAKAAVSFEVHPVEGGTRLVTVTRIAATSAGARAAFAPYWALIRLPSGLIRRSMLAAISRRVAAGAGSLRLDQAPT